MKRAKKVPKAHRTAAKAQRNVQIRRKQSNSPISIDIEAVKVLIDKEMAPLKEQIAILKFNSHCAGVLIRDLCKSAEISHHATGSAKARMEEYFTHVAAAATNLESYLIIPDEDLPQQVDLDVFTLPYQITEDEIEPADYAEDIVENLSSDEEWNG